MTFVVHLCVVLDSFFCDFLLYYTFQINLPGVFTIKNVLWV